MDEEAQQTKRHVEFTGKHVDMLEAIAEAMDVKVATAARWAVKGYYEQVFKPATSKHEATVQANQSTVSTTE